MFFKKLKEAVKEVADELDSGLKDITKDSSQKGTTQKVSKTKDEIDTLPVKCTIQVRSSRYNRLAMNKRIEVSSRKEYENIKKGLLNEFRSKFGTYHVSSSKSVNVWTDKAFNELVKTIVFDDKNVEEALKKHGKW
ncbi:MAG: hypothetical protein ACFFDW_12060 [Candidatus Thorarchaeota archaeon]